MPGRIDFETEDPAAVVEALKGLRGARTFLYLSSGHRVPDEYREIPYDAIVLVNYGFANPPADDRLFCLATDNNRAVVTLHAAGAKVHCVVGITDGCCEGGNYECVNSTSFFGRLSPILADEILYVTDHWHRACLRTVSRSQRRFPDVPYRALLIDDAEESWRRVVAHRDFPATPAWRATRMHSAPTRGSLGRLACTAQHRSIYDDLFGGHLDGAFVAPMCHAARRNYFNELTAGKVADVSRFAGQPFRFFLEHAANKGWRRVGLVPIGRDRYPEAVHAMLEWTGELPEEVNFYHLHAGDMRPLREMLTQTS